MTDLKKRLEGLTPEKRALLIKKLAQKQAAEKIDIAPDKITANPEQRYEPFPLTELQQAYWIGRSGAFEMGKVAGYAYHEIEDELDYERLNKAFRKLIARHEMMRVVISRDGDQRILEEIPAYKIDYVDLTQCDEDVREKTLAELRYNISHQVLPSDQWPLFTITAAQLSDGLLRLHIGFDALIVDGWSLTVIFTEWAQLYHRPDEPLPPLNLTFRDYVFAERALKKSSKFKADADYWKQRIGQMAAAPDLPLAKTPQEVDEGRFTRLGLKLGAASWNSIKQHCNQSGVTPIVVLLTAYAYVIGMWSQSRNFCLNIPQFNRFPLDPQVNSIVGEAASFSLLDIDIGDKAHFLDEAKVIQQQLWNDLDHNYFTGVDILRELSTQGKSGSESLKPVVFTGAPQAPDGTSAYTVNAARLIGNVTFAVNQTPQVWLDNHIYEYKGVLGVDWDYVGELFPEGMQEDMGHAYIQLLEWLAADQSAWQASWLEITSKLLPESQKTRRTLINDNKRDVPQGLLQDLFIAHAETAGDSDAVITTQRTLSYRELLGLANRWGRRLRELGATPNKLVAIVMDKGWEQAVAAYGVLQSGAAYAPMDALQPPERLCKLLENSGVELVLTQSWLIDKIVWPEGVTLLCVDTDDVAEYDDGPLPHLQTQNDLAYVIYTSGSTGTPKGVMLNHRGVVNAIVETNRCFNVGSDDRVLAVTALHHDMSIYDMFGMLGAGGSIVMPDPEERRDPAHWVEMMQKFRPTIWNSVPAMMDMLLCYTESHPGSATDSLRTAFLGGDWIPLGLPARLKKETGAQLVSVGGPTETTLWNIWYPVEQIDPAWKSIPYGKPMANTRYYILGEALAPCPDWVAGEMCVAGIGVAMGYWQDEQKTAEKFVKHPTTGERLYRTGDLGRYLPDGNIQFVGRTDFQIKIQGQRIECGEIEAALQQHESVISAVVTVAQTGKQRLLAYLVKAPGYAIDETKLREHLASRIPDYMVPTMFIALDELPLTRNGKVDRKSLPEPQDSPSESAISANNSEIVAQLNAMICELLSMESLSNEANLISMGANSLDMVKIGNQLEKMFGFRPRMDEIFRLQSVNAIADYCRRNSGEDNKAKVVEDEGELSGVKALIASYQQLRDPAEREAFKNSQPGIRKNDEDKEFLQLKKPVDDEAFRKKYANRFSHRRFGLQRIPFEQFSDFLSCFYQIELDGKPKYLYSSPGGLYATQVYAHVKPGRIEGIPAGTYYYHPIEHRLVTLTKDAKISRTIHVPYVNTPIYDEAAFSLFFVTDLGAVAPSYGKYSTYLAKLETGIIAHLVDESAREHDLAVCQIGGANFDQVRELFDVEERHYFVHSLLGGAIYRDGENNVAIKEDVNSRVTGLVERIKQLSKEEVNDQLKARSLVEQKGAVK